MTAMPTPPFAEIAAVIGLVAAAASALLRNRLACLVVGHRVGTARAATESSLPGSRCVRCGRAYEGAA